MPVSQYKSVRQHVDRSLIMRLRLFCAIFPLKLAMIVLETVNGQITIALVVLGVAIGLVPGIVMSFTYQLDWDEHISRVVAQINWIGGVILMLYTVLMICRYWIETSVFFATFILCISAGFMLGRLIGVRRGVFKILRSLGYFQSISKK